MDDLAYFGKRLLQEEAAANNATGHEARERHEELAAAYRFRTHLIAAQSLDFRPVPGPECVHMASSEPHANVM